MGSEIRKAAYSIHNMFTSEWIEDKAIPRHLFSAAKVRIYCTFSHLACFFVSFILTSPLISKPHHLTSKPPPGRSIPYRGQRRLPGGSQNGHGAGRCEASG